MEYEQFRPRRATPTRPGKPDPLHQMWGILAVFVSGPPPEAPASAADGPVLAGQDGVMMIDILEA